MKRVIRSLSTIGMSLMIISGVVSPVFAKEVNNIEGINLDKREVLEVFSLSEKLDKYRSDGIEEKINLLQRFSIVSGSDKGMELERSLNRVEGASVYSRIMGYLDKVEEFKKSNPKYDTGFNDIPEWASEHINYLHKQGEAFGVNKHSFGAFDEMTAEQFTTLILRGLGYSDEEGDFQWNNSLDKAVEIGLLSNDEKIAIEKDKLFIREEMMIIAYNALFTNSKSTNKKLVQDRQKVMKYPEIMRVVSKELNEKEKNALENLVKDPGKSSSNDDIQELYTKIADLRKEVLELPNMNLNGELCDFVYEHYKKVDKIYVAKINVADDEIYATFNDAVTIPLKHNNGKLYLVDDERVLKGLLSLIISIEGKSYGMDNRLMAEYVYDDGNIDIDVYDTNDIYLESLKTIAMDKTELSWDMEYVQKDLKKYEREYYEYWKNK